MIHTDSIIKLYQDGFSSIEVANQLKTTKRLVLYRLKKAKIARRSLSQALRQYIINETFFETINTEPKAYWLGFLLADGNISYAGRNRKSRVLRCTLQRRDKQHLIKFMKAIDTNKPIKDIQAIERKSGKQYPASFARVTCTKLCHDLETLGWHEFKQTGNTKILSHVPVILQRHLMRGLIDGDGWITNSKRVRLGYCDLHQQVVEWVRDHINLGQPKIKRRNNNKCCWIIYTGKKRIQHLLIMLYANCNISLERKFTTACLIVPHQSMHV